ncbi:hypothetical protein CYLTODRAFT_490363 [Cylindrobasidium torrendii FP15055 ss-10]|uniref:Uncharacterized protein n=1 Tax=Cylindrobasidium torrendii FP15055 ss-10 TaxID=1314674 RepID=A0A0D7BDT5_9AGAR|nr:hypothetical protein CYLTODRAFT_490363 [Cylindrobasidium torrendii FP15055 ss-10]
MFNYRDLSCGGPQFCFCVPLRVCVIAMALLEIVFSSVSSGLVWYEASDNPALDSGEHASFLASGVVQVIILLASILSLVSAVLRKQLLAQISAFTGYALLLINIIITALLFHKVSAIPTATTCNTQDPNSHDGCTHFLKLTHGAYYAVAVLAILSQLCGSIVGTRYMNQLKSEKQMARAGLIAGPAGYKFVPDTQRYSSWSVAQGAEDATPMMAAASPGPMLSPARISTAPSARSFDPYEELSEYHDRPSFGPDFDADADASVESTSKRLSRYDVESGYGGGDWTHEDVAADEKARLCEEEGDVFVDSSPEKPKSRPLPVIATKSTESLPRYTAVPSPNSQSRRPLPPTPTGQSPS